MPPERAGPGQPSGSFERFADLLQRGGECVPRLLIDLDRLDQNLARLISLQPPAKLRLVAKSLPSIGLLEYLGKQLWGESSAPRLMVFHLPFLLQLARRFPDADFLLGKPLPVAALTAFYRQHEEAADDRRGRVQWLVDTLERLEQVAALGKRLRRRITVSLELDVGMHRGGFASNAALFDALGSIRSKRAQLRLGGFMGYDAHSARAPWPRTPLRACQQAAARYADWVALARADFSDLEETPWCINGAGSPTLSMHGADSPLNDFSVGSALLKPAGFDLPWLEEFRPAAWIAAPVLKRLAGVHLPFLEWLPLWRRRDTVFLYGGRWMAVPAWPPGLRENALYGASSNQQMMTIPRASRLEADDFAFLRPTQSEAVLLQFGDLLAIRDNAVVAEWPVLSGQRDGAAPGPLT